MIDRRRRRRRCAGVDGGCDAEHGRRPAYRRPMARRDSARRTRRRRRSPDGADAWNRPRRRPRGDADRRRQTARPDGAEVNAHGNGTLRRPAATPTGCSTAARMANGVDRRPRASRTAGIADGRRTSRAPGESTARATDADVELDTRTTRATPTGPGGDRLHGNRSPRGGRGRRRAARRLRGRRTDATRSITIEDPTAGRRADDFDADGDSATRARRSAGTDPNVADGDVDGLLDGESIGTGSFGGAERDPTAADGAVSVFAADVDGDGDMDVLSASRLRRQDRLVRERRQPELHRRTRSPPPPTGPSRVFAADVDGDGDIDVLSASAYDDKIAWYENDGSQNFTPHTDHHRRRRGLPRVRGGRGRRRRHRRPLRVGYDDKIAWYENDGSQNFTRPHDHHRRQRGLQRVRGGRGRRRRHGRPLRVALRRQDRLVRERRQPELHGRTPSPPPPTGPSRVFAADVDGDGDMDVLSASCVRRQDRLVRERRQPELHGRTRSPPPPTGPAACSRRTWTATATLDVLSASLNDDKIAWYENDGSQNFTARTDHHRRRRGPSVFAADVDGDGDLDVLSASYDDDKIAWYEQANVADPLDPDSDDDGLLDGAEVNTHATDPLDADSDDDGLLDGFEVAHGLDPLTARAERRPRRGRPRHPRRAGGGYGPARSRQRRRRRERWRRGRLGVQPERGAHGARLGGGLGRR